MHSFSCFNREKEGERENPTYVSKDERHDSLYSIAWLSSQLQRITILLSHPHSNIKRAELRLTPTHTQTEPKILHGCWDTEKWSNLRGGFIGDRGSAKWVCRKPIKEWRVGFISFVRIGLGYSTPANATLFLKATLSKASNQFPFRTMRFLLLPFFAFLEK